MDPTEVSTAVFETILPMFIIIGSGYICVYTKILSSESIRYLSRFVFYISLPALLFRDVALSNSFGFHQTPIIITLCSTFIIWLLTVFICLYFIKIDNWGKAGIYSLATTFSSTVFLGHPIISSISPNEIIYCSLFFAVWNVSIVPLSELLLQVHKLKQEKDDEASPTWTNATYSKQQRMVLIALRVFLRSVCNPITISVLGAVLFRLAVHGPASTPLYLRIWVDLIGNAATGTSLFCIGGSMYGRAVLGRQWRTAALLTIMKQLVMPAVVYLVFVVDLQVANPPSASRSGTTDPASRRRQALVSSILNMLPPAQALYLIAERYDVVLDTVSSTLVLSGVTAFPVIYVAVAFLSLPASRMFVPQPYIEHNQDLIRTNTRVMGSLSIIAAIITLIPSLSHPRLRASTTRRLLAALCISQLLSSIAFMLSQNPSFTASVVRCSLQGTLLQAAVLASVLWYAVIALHLVIVIVYRPLPHRSSSTSISSNNNNNNNHSSSSSLLLLLSSAWRRSISYIMSGHRLEIIYHIVIWSLAIVSAIIPFLSSTSTSTGYGAGNSAWCWIVDPNLQFILFYGPFMVLSAAVAVCILIVVLRIRHGSSLASPLSSLSSIASKIWHRIRHPYQTIISSDSSPSPSSSLPIIPSSSLTQRLVLRCVVFVIVFAFTWTWGLAHRFQYLLSLRSYTRPHTSFFLVFLHSIFSAGQAIGTFVVFGTGATALAEYRRLWARAVVQGRHIGDYLQRRMGSGRGGGRGRRRGRNDAGYDYNYDGRNDDRKKWGFPRLWSSPDTEEDGTGTEDPIRDVRLVQRLLDDAECEPEPTGGDEGGPDGYDRNVYDGQSGDIDGNDGSVYYRMKDTGDT